MRKILLLCLWFLLPCALWAQVDSLYVTQDSISIEQNLKSNLRKTKSKVTFNSLPNQEAVDKYHKHSPKVAACLSLIPGGGQIYNQKYWKLPIVYGTMGAATYFVCDYAKKYNLFKREYINRMYQLDGALIEDFALYTDDNIKEMRNSYRSRMEISIAALSIVYLLNIIDACVDAHLFYFDISDDLACKIAPSLQSTPALSYYSYTPSVTFTLNLR